MGTIKAYLTLLTIAIFAISCEKEININLQETDKKIVVEGVIEVGVQPYVTLTNSIGFFDKIDLGAISYIKDAVITVEDITNGKKVILKEYKVDTTVGGQTFFFNIYAPDFLDPVAMDFKGEFEHTYKLTIEANGKTHTAFTKIPLSTGLDSLVLEPVKGKEDSFSVIRAIYRDPDTLGNAVRLETLVNRFIKTGIPEQFYTSFNSVYDDNIINGTNVPLSIELGFDRTRNYSPQELNNIGYVKKGDTVTIKWSAIDGQVYRFWETLAFSNGSVGNPFASPTKVMSNVSDALGVWAGYGSYYYTIIDSIK